MGIEKCIQWELARSQRHIELQKGDGFNGTKGYECLGCYMCTGYNANCNGYYTPTTIKAIADKYRKIE